MTDNLCSYRYNSLILRRAYNHPVQKAVSRLPCASAAKPVFVRSICKYEISSFYRLIFVWNVFARRFVLKQRGKITLEWRSFRQIPEELAMQSQIQQEFSNGGHSRDAKELSVTGAFYRERWPPTKACPAYNKHWECENTTNWIIFCCFIALCNTAIMAYGIYTAVDFVYSSVCCCTKNGS